MKNKKEKQCEIDIDEERQRKRRMRKYNHFIRRRKMKFGAGVRKGDGSSGRSGVRNGGGNVLSRSFEEVKLGILEDVRKHLRENRETVIANNFKITDDTCVGNGAFDDLVFETIYYKYMPVAYDDLIEWTKQEPVLINKTIPPSGFVEDETILGKLENNIISYLKAWVYERLDRLVEELR